MLRRNRQGHWQIPDNADSDFSAGIGSPQRPESLMLIKC